MREQFGLLIKGTAEQMVRRPNITYLPFLALY